MHKQNLKGQHGFVSTTEVSRQYFKSSNVNHSAINPLAVIKNPSSGWNKGKMQIQMFFKSMTAYLGGKENFQFYML